MYRVVTMLSHQPIVHVVLVAVSKIPVSHVDEHRVIVELICYSIICRVVLSAKYSPTLVFLTSWDI